MAVTFDTYSAAQAASVSSTETTLSLLGYYAVGDGGLSIYRKVASAPPQGGLQTADGAWWELVSDGEVNVIQFGAVSDPATPPTADCRVAIDNAQHYLVRKFGGGVVNIPAGYYYHKADTYVVPMSNITYRGAGRGVTIIISDDNFSGSAYAPFYYSVSQTARLQNTSFENFTIRGMLQTNIASGRGAINISKGDRLRFVGMGIEYVRSSAILLGSCNGVVVNDFYGYGSLGRMISCTDTPNVVISDFYIFGSQDDAIYNASTDSLPAPVRQGLAITNGILEESQGPTIYGAQHVTISSVTMRRVLNKGLFIGRTTNGSGNTAGHSISLSDIVIADVIRFAYAPFADTGANHYLYIGSGWRTTGFSPPAPPTPNKSYIGAPGRPDASGAMVPLYGSDQGNYETNDTDLLSAGAGGVGFTASNVTLHRTLPAVSNASAWGYNSNGLFAPRFAGTLYYDGVVDDVMFNNYGLWLEPSLGRSMLSDMIIRATGDYGIYLSPALKPTATSSFTANFAVTTMSVTAVTSGPLLVGQALSGTGVTAAQILSQVNGTPGGTGDYIIDNAQTSTGVAVSGSVAISADVDQFGFDGVEFARLNISDVNLACLRFNGPSGTYDNMTVRDCVFDGDPLLRSQQRGTASKAVWQMKGAFTASITGTTMTVTAVSSGALVAGQTLFGPSISGSVQISSQSSGTPGGVGTYIVSTSQSVSNKALVAVPGVASNFTASYGSSVLTVTTVSSGTIIPGQIIYVPGTAVGYVHIVAQTGGTPGGAGTYIIDSGGSQSSTAFVGWIGDGPVGADVSRAGGFRFIGCQFRNLVQPILEGSGHNFRQDNLVLGQPVAFGFSASNKGVAYCPDVGGEYGILWEESDPANYQTFGAALETGVSVSAAIPVSGYYAPGQFVSAQAPVISSGKVLAGWRRLTFGNGQVSGTDWAPQYISIT
jgi:hypothetical protein